ncbi:hypothetical protein R5W24_004254 [Gemmata sp. JC717]|uniref:hypothetical protein n=1 Tax=Gemmata algarum TaxID=2975278 RepID=UPI0021BADB82|nr:hypothetical protein [Gemmata algarum]MDY3555119.1 hypothetical protein [Gemmata algarum]
MSTTAHHAARVVRCSYPTAHAASTRFRLALQAITDEENRPRPGTLELDESYFGGKRGRGAGEKVPVFGILERAGRIYAVAVEWQKIRAATVKGSVFDTDEFASYNEV